MKHAKDNLIIGDSAEKRLIYELKQKGCNIVEAIKGAGSSYLMEYALLQDYDLIVDVTEVFNKLNQRT